MLNGMKVVVSSLLIIGAVIGEYFEKNCFQR
jgi:hypothetical protein